MPLYALNDSEPETAGDRFYVAPGAHVMGKVRLGTDVSVWFGAIIRGDNDWITLGARTNIQDGCVLHVDPGFPIQLGEDVTVGHSVILHGCSVGDGALIGMGATILNGAKIGSNCLVGAGALVTEGKTFPDNMLIVGAPARAVRALDPDQASLVRRTAAHYVDRGKRFARDLRVLTRE